MILDALDHPAKFPTDLDGEAILANDSKLASESMVRHITLLTESIADFLQFVRASGDRVLFAESA